MNWRNDEIDEFDNDWDEVDDDVADDDADSPYVPCPHCKREIYEDATMCPYCEQFVVAESSFPKWVIVAAILVLGALLLPFIRFMF